MEYKCTFGGGCVTKKVKKLLWKMWMLNTFCVKAMKRSTEAHIYLCCADCVKYEWFNLSQQKFILCSVNCVSHCTVYNENFRIPLNMFYQDNDPCLMTKKEEFYLTHLGFFTYEIKSQSQISKESLVYLYQQ